MRTYTHRRRLLPALLLLLALVLGACGSDGPDDDSAAGSSTMAASAGAFPVSIEHAFGTTEITEAPQRVVTWGWGSADAAIALGTIPVAMPFQEYGGNAQGLLPWIEDALAKDGAETPTILPKSDDAPIEAIAAAEPDLILAVYSGITDKEYELLSRIAPTVAYPDQAWSTPWKDTIEIVGRALGKADRADELLADIDARIEEQGDAHPELAGRSVALVWDTGDTFYVYKKADARVEFTLGLGLTSAPSVDELSAGSPEDSTFYYTLSKERVGDLKSDILVSYADDETAQNAFLASPAAQLMDQVRTGHVAEVNGTELIAAVSPPTALSLTWGLDDYVEALSAAAKP
jgi:iron complex transport system substrate-binding protein